MGTKIHNIDMGENRVTQSVETMFNQLKGDTKLSESDIKARNIPLRMFVYEVKNVSTKYNQETIVV